MSNYLVLARKYRPRTFPELVGQEVVTHVLSGALAEKRLGHAYLFSGPRGTGKTTTARILAKCLNCESGPTATPCGTCERCQAADAGQEPDIIELDAASHTGVDHIRSLRDEVAYAPMRARYKVYIVDEVHMLSKAAFNALLKTLEEPPAHVVFLFATTEPHKVLDTILSRCQVLRLDPISEERIAARLTEVFAAEGVQAEAGVVEELARGARGGMRDALSLADKLLALAGDSPTLDDLQRLGGGGGTRAIDQLLDILEGQDRAALLDAIGEHQGGEVELVDALVGRLRASVVLSHCGVETPLIPGSPEDRQRAIERAQRMGVGRLELWMQELLRCRERMRAFSSQERVVLEVALLELARPETTWSLSELAQRVEALAASIGSGDAVPSPHPAPASAPNTAPKPSSAPAPEPAQRVSPASSSNPGPSRRVQSPAQQAAKQPRTGQEPNPGASGQAPTPLEAWKQALQDLGRSHGAFAALLREEAKPNVTTTGLDIVFAPLEKKKMRLMEDRRSRAALSRSFETYLGRNLELRFVQSGTAPETPAQPGPASGGEAATSRGPEPQHDPRRSAAREAKLPNSRPGPPPTTPSDASATEPAPGKPSGPKPTSLKSQQEPSKKGRPKDKFTQDVADLFGGVVEDM